MKTKLLPIVALIFLVLAAGCAGKPAPGPGGDAGNQPPAKVAEPALPAGYVILDRQSGNVTGSGKLGTVFLIGRKPDAKSPFADDLSVIVQDAAGQNQVIAKLPGVAGYESKLTIGDFSGDKVDDVLVKIPTGGSGGIVEHRILTFVGEPKTIFGKEENRGVRITGHFVDGFKAELTEETTKRKVTVDQVNKQETYIKANLYDAQGNVLRQQTTSLSPFGALDPVDLERDGVLELRGQQRVSGLANADTVANVTSIWKYQDGKWVLRQIEVSTLLLRYGEK